MSASPVSKSLAGLVAFSATSQGRIEVRHGWIPALGAQGFDRRLSDP
jgi:hypothetical protein